MQDVAYKPREYGYGKSDMHSRIMICNGVEMTL